MADNVTITSGANSTPPAGTVIGTDEVTIGGVLQQVQRVKLVDGADGGTGLIGGDAANGLDVDVTRVSGNVTVVQSTASNLKVDASGAAVPVTDNSGSLTVDNAGTFAVQATIAAGAAAIAKAEDVASADADVGVPAMAVRKATPANTSGTDGDYEMLQMSAGRLWASATIDAALPAGTNAIGKLAANDGVDVGDVTINNASGGGAVNIQDGGNSITVDGTVTGNQGTAAATTAGWPVLGGNVARSSAAWTSSTTVDTTLAATVTGYNAVVVTLRSTSTITGGVILFEVSDDNTNWYPIAGTRINAFTNETSYTLIASDTKAWEFDVGGFTNFRVRLNPVITGTGTVNLGLTAQAMSAEPAVTVGQSVAASLNATVNTAQIAGTTVDTNSGTKSAGTQRIVIATDQPQLTNALKVDGSAVTQPVSGTITASNTAGDVAHDGVDSGNPVKVGGKAANTMPAAVSANGDRTNLLSDMYGRPIVINYDPGMQVWKQVEASTAQTGTAIWTPAGGHKVVVTSMEITTGGTTAGVVTVWFGASADTTFTQGTDQVVFRGEFAPSSTSKPGVVLSWQGAPRYAATADHVLRYTTSAAITVYITVYGYEI